MARPQRGPQGVPRRGRNEDGTIDPYAPCWQDARLLAVALLAADEDDDEDALEALAGAHQFNRTYSYSNAVREHLEHAGVDRDWINDQFARVNGWRVAPNLSFPDER